MAPDSAKKRPLPYFMASTCAAILNYPLWRVSAIGQSGFKYRQAQGTLQVYLEAFKPPYKGIGTVVFGMTWARAAIFYGSDIGRQRLRAIGGVSPIVCAALPPLVMSTFVQFVNQPIVRASITLQDPSADHRNVASVLRSIVQRHGVWALWHGLSAGVIKTVPKYCTAIVAKDLAEEYLPETYEGDLRRSAVKSVLAGVAGATLTNPADVVRNEMFKTNQGLLTTVRRLYASEPGFATRGLAKNVVSVAIPIAVTIFATDLFSHVL